MAALATVDLLILAIVLLSVLVGGVRGFVREALSLVIWIAAFIIAGLFSDALARQLAGTIASEALRFPVAFGLLFVATLIVGALVSKALGMLVDATGLTGLDRVLGVLFGAARAGVLLVVVAAMAVPLFANEGWWQASVLLPWLIAAQDATFEFFRSAFDAVSTATEA
ncbi:MAG TPA: CvpA family protein [Pseudomonadales bacterium]|nr:CvpA family protein [Pseudomonadales bacterium]